MSKFKDPSEFADFYDPSLNLNYYGDEPDEDYDEELAEEMAFQRRTGMDYQEYYEQRR